LKWTVAGHPRAWVARSWLATYPHHEPKSR
jgi:hypothetical protein